MHSTYIPPDVFENLTHGFAKRLNDGLNRCMGFDDSHAKQMLADYADDTRRQTEASIRPV